MGEIALNNLNLCAKVIFHDSKFKDFNKRIISQLNLILIPPNKCSFRFGLMLTPCIANWGTWKLQNWI
jgi:hypothetical protein